MKTSFVSMSLVVYFWLPKRVSRGCQLPSLHFDGRGPPLPPCQNFHQMVLLKMRISANSNSQVLKGFVFAKKSGTGIVSQKETGGRAKWSLRHLSSSSVPMPKPQELDQRFHSSWKVVLIPT